MSTPLDRGPRQASGAPDPLVPVDLVFPSANLMPIDRRWIRDPERRARWRPEDWLVALTLRAASLEQAPPASLPSDEASLALLARRGEPGRAPDVAEWSRALERALEDWVLCADGRLYHPQLAVWVLELWLAFDLEAQAAGAGGGGETRLDAAYHLQRLEMAMDGTEEPAPNPGTH